MVILHIGSIHNDLFNGVCVAVPMHVNVQAQYADVGFLNINNEVIENINSQIEFKPPFDISYLKAPFNKPDLVVFHECYRIEYLKIAKNIKENGVKYIIVPHGELRKEAQEKKYLKKKLANILLFNNFIANAEAIQCLSENEMKDTCFNKKKFIGTNGVFLTEERNFRNSNGSIKFIYIGRYEWRVKGLDILFDAVKLVDNYMREKKCTIEMYGPDIHGRFDAVKTMIEERDISDIIFLNHEIKGQNKKEKLLDSDVFIQTSRFEGLPMGLLEALSYGIPCLVTEGTSLGSYIREYNAGWVAKTNSTSLAEQIVETIKEKDSFQAKGESGRKLISEKFEWNTVAKKTIDSYMKVIDK